MNFQEQTQVTVRPVNWDTETVGGWSKIDKIPNVEHFVGNTGLNVVIDGPSVMHQFVKGVVADNLIQLSLISHRQNADKWKIFVKFLKVTEHYQCGNEKCFRTHTLFL
jgi:hypothetical protein